MEALGLTQNNGLEFEEGYAYYYLGNYYRKAGLFYLAHVHFKKAEKLFGGVLNRLMSILK